MSWSDLQCFVEFVQCLLQLVRLQVNKTFIVVCLNIQGVQLDSFAEVLQCPFILAQIVEEGTPCIVKCSIIRLQFNALCVVLGCLIGINLLKDCASHVVSLDEVGFQ